jgi:hypothetical protein
MALAVAAVLWAAGSAHALKEEILDGGSLGGRSSVFSRIADAWNGKVDAEGRGNAFGWPWKAAGTAGLLVWIGGGVLLARKRGRQRMTQSVGLQAGEAEDLDGHPFTFGNPRRGVSGFAEPPDRFHL